MTPFDQFWQAWPSSPRKASKSLVKAKWEKMGLDIHIHEILRHVAYMKTQDAWLKGNGQFIPAPMVYINQMRWDGADIPDHFVAEKSQVDPALKKIEEDSRKAAPMPTDVAKKLQELRRQILH